MADAVEAVPATQPDENPKGCLKCGRACSVADGAVVKGGGLHCRLCNNVYQLLYRHLGGMPPGLQSLSAAEQREFFQSASEMCKAAGKNTRWALVKKELTSSIVRFRTTQTRNRVNWEYLPLSAWKTRGFDTDLIKEKGDKKDCPVTGLDQ